jgi:hypothetical protein
MLALLRHQPTSLVNSLLWTKRNKNVVVVVLL